MDRPVSSPSRARVSGPRSSSSSSAARSLSARNRRGVPGSRVALMPRPLVLVNFANCKPTLRTGSRSVSAARRPDARPTRHGRSTAARRYDIRTARYRSGRITVGLDPGLRRLALGTLLAAYPGPVAAGLGGRPGRRRAGRAHPVRHQRRTTRPRWRRCTAALRAGPAGRADRHRRGGRRRHPAGARHRQPVPGQRRARRGRRRRRSPAGSTRRSAPNWPPSASTSTWPRPSTSTPPTTTRSSAPGRSAPTRCGWPRTRPPRSTGLQAAGVAACAKHFPGHGATVADSHHELPTVDVPLDAAARAGPAAVRRGRRRRARRPIMTAHIRVPALTGDGPATFSRAVLVDLLRGEYGFTGAVITDALEMKGAARGRRRGRAGRGAGPGRRRRPALHRREGRRRAGRAGGRRDRRRRSATAGWRGPGRGGRRPRRRARRLDPGRRPVAGRPRPPTWGTRRRAGPSGWRASLDRPGPAAGGAAAHRVDDRRGPGAVGPRPAPGRRRADPGGRRRDRPGDAARAGRGPADRAGRAAPAPAARRPGAGRGAGRRRTR